MLTKQKIKLIKSLELKKNRSSNNCFVVEGEKMVLELLNSNLKILELFAVSVFIENHKKLINNNLHYQISETELSKISALKTPNQVLAVVEMPKHKSLQINAGLNLVLDNIQDPGNLGTIIRTANWFGVEQIYCSENTVDAYNSKVIQATMGAIFRTKIAYVNIEHLLKIAKEKSTPIYGTLLTGSDLYTTTLKQDALIVLGNESKGISNSIEAFVDHKIRIPNYPPESKAMESLNVGIANAIVLAEFRRSKS